jgi:hypothetical protein
MITDQIKAFLRGLERNQVYRADTLYRLLCERRRETDGDRIAGDWRRIGGYIGKAMIEYQSNVQ